MDAIPSLPPYAHVTQEAVQCAAKASLRYDVPELLLHAILMKENGRVGKTSRNRNGTEDLGPAQINSSQVPRFAAMGLNREYILNDFCTNIYVSAYIIRENYNKKHDWFQAIVSYNIGPNNWTQDRYRVGYNYAVGVVRYWWSFQNYVDAQHGIRRVASQSGTAAQEARPAAPAGSSGQQLVYSVSPDGDVSSASPGTGQ